MKKLFILPICTLLIGACTMYEQERIDRPNQEEPVIICPKDTVLHFTAHNGEETTKTEWQSNGEIWWNVADEIAVFYGASSKNRFTSTNNEIVKTAVFSGTISAFTGETESGDFNYFWAIYPYNAAGSCDGSSVIATLPHAQTAQAGTFAPNTNITLAKSAGLSLAFYNVCAWFRFSVAQEGVNAVIFKGNNNEDVAGTFSVSMDGSGRPTAPVIEDGLGQKEIRLTLPGNVPFEVGVNYYFTVLPQLFSKGFTLEFETDYTTASRSINVSVPFTRNVYHTGNNFDADIPYDCTEMPLCFEAIEDGSIGVIHLGTLKYKKNNAAWTSYSGTISVSAGDKVYFKGNGCLVDDEDTYTYFEILHKGYMYGNVMSLYDEDNFATLTTLASDFNAGRLFWKTKILSHPRNLLILPATVLTTSCYHEMFMDCTELTRAPALPATTLTPYCYKGMFSGCSKLVTPPSLPATVLAEECYDQMFKNCIALENAPELPAVSLARCCYQNMFYWCTSLSSSPYLPALKLEQGCYYGMFYGCSSLQKITMMATDISASNCLNNWVYGVPSGGTITKNILAGWDTVGDSGSPSSWTIETDHAYTDLGLSVLWSPYNLGATGTSEIGDYYAWGETAPKDNYRWTTYQFGNYSDGSLTKYCNNSTYGTVDDLTELEVSDDAAYASWGVSWRIPTKEDFEELEDNCTVSLQTYGLLKVTGPNGNYILVPYSSIKDSEGVYPTPSGSATFWSSTVHGTDCRYADAYYIWNDYYDPIAWGGWDRYVGFPIRPVRER